MSKIVIALASLVGVSVFLGACEPAGTGGTGGTDTSPTVAPETSPVAPADSPTPSPTTSP
ncbi:hypothetical protein HJG54_32375 [Leptolyngbya sp. NK1-12]|uniref:Serine protease n=1 Tax=Leptolyngbya sp. NK1-12 TaxID=2547451 RepID=A0AA96WZ53_9CYAN|nr:hypothetical protein [Leptolyngbya sp. NK1-12]MBF2050173.1 hypothetical protein [Elainella sp. C42_A2020_010]WNZ27567.1 hypothetical protein HJG54_32375 [Leptolyngbya sp. NK1-12]